MRELIQSQEKQAIIVSNTSNCNKNDIVHQLMQSKWNSWYSRGSQQ